jgi:hypothetical protein
LSSRTTATAAEGDGNNDDAAAAARDKGDLDQNSARRYHDALLLSQIYHTISSSNSLEQSTVTPNPATQPNLVITKNSPAQRSSGPLQCKFRSTVRAHWRFFRSSLPRLRNCPHISSVICPSSLDGTSLPSAATVAATRCCKLHAVRCHASCAPRIEPLQGQEKAPAAAPLIGFSPGASVARVYLICVAMLCFHNRRSVGVHCGPGIVVTSLNIIRQTLYYDSEYITTYLIKTFWCN